MGGAGEVGSAARDGTAGRIDLSPSRASTRDSRDVATRPSALVERLKINGALARAAIKELQEKGMIKMVSYHHTQWIFTRDVAAE